MALLGHQLEDLDAAYNKSKRLKGVQKTIKQIMDRFKKAHPGSIAEQFRQLSQEDQFTLFFKIGFDQKKLKENVTDLCLCAAEGGNLRLEGVKQYRMIHILLPIYFDDCAEYEPSTETLHAFLIAVARFYREQYEQQNVSPEKGSLEVLIYIPPLKYFEEVCAGKVTEEAKEKLLCTVLKDELFLPMKRSLPLVLINQNASQLQALAHRLQSDGIQAENVRLVELVLMQKLQRTKSFTPYVLKLQEHRRTKVDYTVSPLITTDLLDLLRGEQ